MSRSSSVLGLRFKGIRRERVRCEQIERQLAATLRLAHDAVEQRRADLREVGRERSARRGDMLFHGALEPLP